MKKRSTAGYIVAFSLMAAQTLPAQQPPNEHALGRLLVQTAGSPSASVLQQVIRLHGAKVHHDIPQLGVLVLVTGAHPAVEADQADHCGFPRSG